MREVRDVEETAATSDAPPPELTRYLGYLMRRVHARFAADPGDDGDPRDCAVLTLLAEQEVRSQRTLAERLGINRTIMVNLVERLEREGYVARTRNPDNRRTYLLSLTDAGQLELARLRRVVAARDERLTAVLSPAERRRLNELLRALLPEHERTSSDPGTAFLVSQVNLHLRRRADGMLADVGLRTRHCGPLSVIDWLGPCPQQRLARQLAINGSATAALVDELVRAGLVTRGQDPTDRRRYALTLTDLGRARLGTVREVAERIQAEVTGTLGPTGEAELRSLLTRLLPTGGGS